MLKRIFADNFRSLVNFELRPGPLSLLLGDNGSGKTTVFDVLGKLRDLLVLGSPVSSLFSHTTTLWDTRSLQRFELEIENEGRTYRYALEIQHPEPSAGRPFIRNESLSLDGSLLYRLSDGEVTLVHDDETAGPVFPFRPDGSFLPNIDPTGSRQLGRLAGFKTAVAGIWVVQPNPFNLDLVSQIDLDFLARDGRNFASFFGYLNSELPEARTALEERLRRALPGFRNLRFRRVGETRALRAAFTDPQERSYEVGLGELSEGQRALAILYSALSALRPGSSATLCFDEPDNFVSLPEIQPWLHALRDTLEDHGGQAMIISHHPEVMDYLALDSVWRFERPSGPVIVRPFEGDTESALKLSEIVARGA